MKLLTSHCLVLALTRLLPASAFVAGPSPSVPKGHSLLRQNAKSARPSAEEDAASASRRLVVDPVDGRPVKDADHQPVTVDRFLATQPLQRDLLTRKGPGRSDLNYMSGETVISTLNKAFGYDGWNLEVRESRELYRGKNDRDQWEVATMAHVRITLNGEDYGPHSYQYCFREDYGTGQAVNFSQSAAVQQSLKSSVTDAVKRAARHFGDKLGNCLYREDFDPSKSPKTLHDALEDLEHQ